MLNQYRMAAGIIAVWLAIVGILTVWPKAPESAAPASLGPVAPTAETLVDTQNAIYVHTGLWVADVRTDGTVVYLRQIKRR